MEIRVSFALIAAKSCQTESGVSSGKLRRKRSRSQHPQVSKICRGNGLTSGSPLNSQFGCYATCGQPINTKDGTVGEKAYPCAVSNSSAVGYRCAAGIL